MKMSVKKIAAIILVMILSSSASGSDVEVWQDPSVDFGKLKKIFVMPAEIDLRAGTQLAPVKKVRADIFTWTVDGIHSAFGRRSSLTVKNVDAVIEDMKFIHGDNVSVNDPLFFKRAAEMGYTAFIRTELTQEFMTEHVPETERTYTVYREIEKRDSKGRVIETLRIPEEKTEIIPAHDVEYLYTVCMPKIYSTNDADGDYIGAVNYRIYREYQGGPVMKVVENITKASMKSLFTGKN